MIFFRTKNKEREIVLYAGVENSESELLVANKPVRHTHTLG